jgi:WD40 repeat protein
MSRVPLFCPTRRRRWQLVPTQLKKSEQERNPTDDGATSKSIRSIPSLPGAIWVTQVMPYLDRISQNRLCMTCRDIHLTSKQFHMKVSWPEGKFRFKRPILAFAFSPDSQVLAIVPSNSKVIILWNRTTGMDQTLEGHAGIVSDVKFDSSRGLLASCSRTDGTIMLWNRTRATDEETRTPYVCVNKLNLRVFAMRYIRFSPCGEMIAVWGNDRVIRLEKIDRSAAQGPFNVGSVPWRSRLGIKCCDSVVFMKRHEENLLVYTFNNEQVRIWNYEMQTVVELRDQERTVPVGDYDAYITAMSTVDIQSPDGGGTRQYLVVGCRVSMLKLWDLEDYSCVRSFSTGIGWSAVTNITFTQDGRTMACTSDGSRIRVFDVESSECIAALSDHRDRVECLLFCPDGQCLVSGSCDRTLRMWDMVTITSSAP